MPAIPRLTRASLLLLGVVFLASCASPPQWQVVEDKASFETIWERFTTIAGRHGYRADAAQSDRGLKKYVSKWREQPLPFRMGRRTRLNAEFERVEPGKPGWRLRFFIEAQGISDIAVAFEPDDEDWEDAGQDFDREQTLLGQLRLAFGQELGMDPPTGR